MRIADLLDTGTVDDKAFNNFLGQLEEKIDGVTSWVECRAYGAADAIKEAALEYAGLAQKWWHFLRYTPRIAAASLLLAVAVGCAKQEVPKYIMPDSPKTYTIPNVNRVASEGEGIKVVFEESSIDVEMRYNTRESTRFFPFDGDPTPGVQQVPFPDPQSVKGFSKLGEANSHAVIAAPVKGLSGNVRVAEYEWGGRKVTYAEIHPPGTFDVNINSLLNNLPK